MFQNLEKCWLGLGFNKVNSNVERSLTNTNLLEYTFLPFYTEVTTLLNDTAHYFIYIVFQQNRPPGQHYWLGLENIS